jgi:hypothetical protein
MAVMVGTDFFTAEVLTLRGLKTYYVLFFLHLESRRICLAGGTQHPDQEWMEQMALNITMEESSFLASCRYLLHDRDSKYCASFRQLMVRFRSTEGAPQRAMFGGEKGRGKDIDRIFDSIQAVVNANKQEMTFKRTASEAALPPLERLAHWVEVFEAAESGRTTGMTEEELRNTLLQASTEMRFLLRHSPR